MKFSERFETKDSFKAYLKKFIEAVRDGEDLKVVEDEWLIAVKNPEFREDNGSDIYLVLRVCSE